MSRLRFIERKDTPAFNQLLQHREDRIDSQPIRIRLYHRPNRHLHLRADRFRVCADAFKVNLDIHPSACRHAGIGADRGCSVQTCLSLAKPPRFEDTSPPNPVKEKRVASYEPDPKLKFTFGLWTVGNIGRDPFGEAVRERITPPQICQLLGEAGAFGVNFHDNDLVPIDATTAERQQIVKDFKAALKDNGLVVPMATTNLFSDPAFKDGAFTSNDAKVRAYAIQKTMRAMDLGAEFGAKIYVFWGGREGVESDATKDPVEAVKRLREAINFLCEYSISQNYGYKFAFEAKPNEPRGHIYFA